METFQALLARKLSDALTAADLPQVGEVTPATDARFGDYQTNAGARPRESSAAKIRAFSRKEY